jgi:hypothetical protein
MIFVWGMAGAFIYATSSLILQLWNKGATLADRTRAAAEYALALVTGGLFALGLTEVLQGMAAHGLTLNGLTIRGEFKAVPVALTVGWASNYLWPRILRKLGEAVDKRNAP